MEEIFDIDSMVVTSCDCSISGHSENCDCGCLSGSTPTPQPKKSKHVTADTPTRQYWYAETQGFIGKKTDESQIKDLADKIIKEYLRATSAETAIISSVTEIDKTIDTIEDVVTEVTTKVDEHTEKIEHLENGLEKEIHDRENADKKLHEHVHHLVEKEECERKHADKHLFDLIQKEKHDRIVADHELETILKQYVDDEVETITLEKDDENERKYYLYVKGEIHGEFEIPEDKYLSNVDYDYDTDRLTITVYEGNGEYKPYNIDLSHLNKVYTAGYGIVISDNNEISAKINQHNRFLTINQKGEIDFDLTVTNGVEGDIWQYFLCGTDGTIDYGDNTKIDLRPIKEYIDNSKLESKEYTDEQITNLRNEINERIKNLLKAGNNIKLVEDENGSVTISVKMDSDMKDQVDEKNLLVDELPESGDTLDEAIKKVLNNIVTNADTTDGEEITF